MNHKTINNKKKNTPTSKMCISLSVSAMTTRESLNRKCVLRRPETPHIVSIKYYFQQTNPSRFIRICAAIKDGYFITFWAIQCTNGYLSRCVVIANPPPNVLIVFVCLARDSSKSKVLFNKLCDGRSGRMCHRYTHGL